MTIYANFVCVSPGVSPGERGHYIPISHAIAIKKRLESGMDYIQASPLHRITREEAAILLNIPWKDLQEK